MSLSLRSILRGPRRRNMGPLLCLLNVQTHFAQIQRKEVLCVSFVLQNNNKSLVPLNLPTKSLWFYSLLHFDNLPFFIF
jgi:hypothetical protein